jgi:hypothetical protein
MLQYRLEGRMACMIFQATTLPKWGMLMHISCCTQGDKEHSELLAKRKQTAMITYNDWKTSQYYERTVDQ